MLIDMHLSQPTLVAEDGFEPPTSWLWAKRATTAPLHDLPAALIKELTGSLV